MEVIGYIAALFIGISLGLTGGGGSILTVPVLVYLFGISPITSIFYSLFIVGTTSLAGSASSYRNGLIDFKTAMLFGIPSVLTVFFSRRFILPLIPPEFAIGDLVIDFSVLMMVLFAVLMLGASVSMITSKKIIEKSSESKKRVGVLFLYGAGLGMITGFLGAGGGFLIIPALVLLLQLPMKKAIGTSLLIIAINSLVGFLGSIGHVITNWNFLIIITAIAIAGVMLGGLLGKNIHGEKLKKGFGWFVLAMGIFIIVKEILF